MSFLSDIETIYEAPSVEAVWDLLVDRLGPHGFDRLMYGLTRYKTANSFGDPQDMLVLTNHPPAYTDHFIGEAMYFHAPMVAWSSENVGACGWHWVQENFETFTSAEKRVLEFNRSMGVVAGYTISFPHSSHRSRGAMALTARDGLQQHQVEEIWKAHGREIHALCNVAHLKLMSLPHTGSRRALTKRQREVLEWVGDGKTTRDIADIIGLTAATVEKHLRLARDALDVETTAQAVMKASLQNQIFTLEA
ncbi:helix-turn-helix transcriptional regulator [Meridianimarinicoccus aquatilis]|uniref:LuxR family transcriptional regulator n=1 Tax=Meridianimarinicoccus aquatilis TaxID=2552766 RepID=A0A4R6B443_9RHOB|nr:LuxR family transcriptional regulator [Fluviibacterium aquatile]TDL89473.1 LuxR family transcriptional regulator [Fluviibacterium aquatile]